MRITTLVFVTLSISATALRAQVTALGAPREAVHAVAQSLGGEALIRNLASMRWEGLVRREMHSIDDRTSGPSPLQLDIVSTLIKLPEGDVRRSAETRFSFRQSSFQNRLIRTRGGVAIEANGKLNAAPPGTAAFVEDEWLANPLGAVLAALDASDLRIDRSTNAAERVLSFSWNTVPIKLRVDARTSLPHALQFTRNYTADIFSAMWGPTTTELEYGDYALEPSGIRFPRSWQIRQHGHTAGAVTITRVEMDAAAPPDSFAISDSVRVAYRAMSGGTAEASAQANLKGAGLEIAPGIVMLPGVERRYNAVLVKQPDGIVVLDAPFSSANSQGVIAEAERRFPGVRITAVVVTSPMWSHVGGIAEYARRNVPIYTLGTNTEIVQALTHATASSTAIVRPVRTGTVIGTDPATRMVLYPFRAPAPDRMLAVYFPALGLLHASDVYLPRQFAGDFYLQRLTDVQALIDENHLRVDLVQGIHMPPAAWADVRKTIPVTASIDPAEPPAKPER